MFKGLKRLIKFGFPKIRKANYPYWIYKVGYGDGHYWTMCNDLNSAIKIWFSLIFNPK